MNTTSSQNSAQTVTLDGIQYGRPYRDHQLRPMVNVEYPDGERFATYAVPRELADAWAEVDTFGRQLTEADV